MGNNIPAQTLVDIKEKIQTLALEVAKQREVLEECCMEMAVAGKALKQREIDDRIAVSKIRSPRQEVANSTRLIVIRDQADHDQNTLVTEIGVHEMAAMAHGLKLFYEKRHKPTELIEDFESKAILKVLSAVNCPKTQKNPLKKRILQLLPEFSDKIARWQRLQKRIARKDSIIQPVEGFGTSSDYLLFDKGEQEAVLGEQEAVLDEQEAVLGKRKPGSALSSNRMQPHKEDHTKESISMKEIANRAEEVGTRDLFVFYRDAVETSKHVVSGQMIAPFVSKKHYPLPIIDADTDARLMDSNGVEVTLKNPPPSIAASTPAKQPIKEASLISAGALGFETIMLTPEEKRRPKVLATPPHYPQSNFVRAKGRKY